MPEMFARNRTVQAVLALEDFVANEGETKDFRINYAFSYSYYDLLPESVRNPSLQFNVTSSVPDSQLGLDSQIGRVFSYRLTLRNTKPFTKPSNVSTITDNGLVAPSIAPPIDRGGLGMVVSVVRIPACLQVDFNFLEGLKRNKMVDFYEVKNFNTEIVLYWRQMRPGEVKNVSIDLIQRYSGVCAQKPHTAYPYYNND